MGSQWTQGETPPLKRHPALRVLSREHMGGLIQARNLTMAADGDLAARTRAVEGFVNAWRTEIREHFGDEERLLLPLAGSPELRARLLSEHRDLRAFADRCETEPRAAAEDADFVRRLGSMLHDHIRWEERIFFEAVQREQPEALDRLTRAASQIEVNRPASRARTRLEWPESRG